MSRRGLLGLLGVGAATVLAGCETPALPPSGSGGPTPAGPGGLPTGDPEVAPTVAPGRWQVLRHGAPGTRQIALTVDDGDCTECVAGYAAFAERTGIALTLSPNGTYDHTWRPQGERLRPLVERGQLQVINHTFTHRDLVRLPAPQVRDELERNEQWINTTFGTTARPYFRPPFGSSNPQVDGLAADLGYDRVVMWNGSYGDAKLVTPQYLLDQARRYLQPGVILLGHANHPTVLGLFDQILGLIHDRALQPVTLDQMFGTHRPP